MKNLSVIENRIIGKIKSTREKIEETRKLLKQIKAVPMPVQVKKVI